MFDSAAFDFRLPNSIGDFRIPTSIQTSKFNSAAFDFRLPFTRISTLDLQTRLPILQFSISLLGVSLHYVHAYFVILPCDLACVYLAGI
jgi:hypothetical protein